RRRHTRLVSDWSSDVCSSDLPAWAAAGLALFPEIEVPSKGFGDFVAHHARPTFITPRELERAIARGEDWVLIDSRPRQEYQAGKIGRASCRERVEGAVVAQAE